MAQCTQTAQAFIQNAFGPAVAVLCSHDAEVLAQKNNLTVVEMIRPFSRLTNEAHIRDPSGQVHTVRNLSLILKELDHQPLSANLLRKVLQETVSSCQPPPIDGNRGNVITVGAYDLQIGVSTPWYETYRDVFLQYLTPSDHEFIQHYVACMLVVSTAHADPMDQFTKLSQRQHFLQHTSKSPFPKWLVPNIFKYYVLVHDNTDGEQEKAEAVYQSLKSTYGSHACHLLRINSRSLYAAETTALNSDAAAGSMPDPWSQYVNKNSDNQQESSEADFAQPADNEGFPDRVTEGGTENLDVENSTMETSIITPEDADALVGLSSPDIPNNHLLADSLIYANQTNTLNEVIAHPLDESSLQTPPKDRQLNTIDSRGIPDVLNANSKVLNSSDGETLGGPTGVHGACLTLSDHDRLRIFIHEFAVRGLLPYIERMIRNLSEQLAARKGLHRSLFSATKKWFGGNKQAEKASITGTDMGGKYLRESPELQMRRLADLAFLVQMYELAYTSYHTAKRDFGNDQAWTHYAGSLEMAAVAAFMLGSMQKAYPTHYMETAVSTYLNTCKKPQFATRAVLISTEILKARGLYAEAAMEFIRMTGEDSDIRSAIFLEQAAHCFINMRHPMVRKYAFHLILAGHRFSKAGQRKHALRAYWQALQVYKGKGWTLSEDHINFTIGRQSFNLKQLENSTAAFKHLLSFQSRQPLAQQSAFFKEYLFIFKQLLTSQSEEGNSPDSLPQLPLPVIDKTAIRVLLTNPKKPPLPDAMTYVTSVTFDRAFQPSDLKEWDDLEVMAVMVATGQRNLPAGCQPHRQLLNARTDNSASPLVVVGESMTVELVLKNPLKVPLIISDLTLRWKFTPVDYEHVNKENPEQQPAVVTNEADILQGKIHELEDVVITEVIEEVILAGIEKKPIHLSVTPQQTGELQILGVAYSLSAQHTSKDEITTSNHDQGGNRENPDSPQKGRGDALNKKGVAGAAVSVQGGQDLDIQGPRLNSTKVERCSVVYGPDRRLHPVVVPSMPLLEVIFTSFPSSLLCGEVCQSMVEFTNRGYSPLHRLLISSNHPELFSFGSSRRRPDGIRDDHDSLDPVGQSKAAGVYVTSACQGGASGAESLLDRSDVCHVTAIPLPEGALPPGGTLSMRMYMRGPEKSGMHEINMLFYYESTEDSPQMSHRSVYHTAILHTSNSISLTGVARRTHAGYRRQRDIKDDSRDTGLIVSLDIANMNQVHDSHIIEFSISQVCCVSSTWALDCFSSDGLSKELKVSGGESQRMCFKARKRSQNALGTMGKEQLVFTGMSFGKLMVDSSAAPCSDFFFRSTFDPSRRCPDVTPSSKSATPSTMSPTEEETTAPPVVLDGKAALEECVRAGLTIIILWKAFVVDEEGFNHTLVGQHHVFMDTIGSEVTTLQTTKRPKEIAHLKITKDPEREAAKEPSPETMGQLLQYSLQYCEVKEHDFSRSRICTLPVSLSLYNCTSTSLQVTIETADQNDTSDVPDKTSLPDYQSPPHHASSTEFAWVGHIRQCVVVHPQTSQRSQLHASFSAPGVYNLASVRLLARSLNEGAVGQTFVAQRRLAPSLVTVTGVSSL